MRRGPLHADIQAPKQWLTLFWGAPKSLQMVIAAMKLKDMPWEKSYDQPI